MGGNLSTLQSKLVASCLGLAMADKSGNRDSSGDGTTLGQHQGLEIRKLGSGPDSFLLPSPPPPHSAIHS